MPLILQRRNSQPKEADSTSKKGANISNSELTDIHNVTSSISGSVTHCETRNVSVGVNKTLSGSISGTAAVFGGGHFDNTVPTISSSDNTVLLQAVMPTTDGGTKSVAHPLAYSGSSHVKLPRDDGLLVSVRQTSVPKVAVALRPSMAMSYDFQDSFCSLQCNLKSSPIPDFFLKFKYSGMKF